MASIDFYGQLNQPYYQPRRVNTSNDPRIFVVVVGIIMGLAGIGLTTKAYDSLFVLNQETNEKKFSFSGLDIQSLFLGFIFSGVSIVMVILYINMTRERATVSSIV
jgi:hypothetical protein